MNAAAGYPPSWRPAMLADICERPEYGLTARASNEAVGPRFVRITDIQEGGVDWSRVPSCECDETAHDKLALRAGDLLIARIGGTTGKALLVRDCPDAVFASYLIRIRARGVDPAFLFYFTQSSRYWQQINARKGDKLKGGVSASVLSDISLMMPKPEEQKGIAAALFRLESRLLLERGRAATLRELKTATMAKLFREGLRGEQLKQTEIGEIPESWSTNTIGELIADARYGLSLKGEKSGKHPILRMNCQDDGDVVFRDLQYVDLDGATFDRFAIQPDDLLFNRTNSFELVGRTAIVRTTRSAVFASYLIRLRLRTGEMEPRFLNYYLNLPSAQLRLKGLATRGVSQSNISASKLRGFEVPVPPVREQREIADQLDAVSSAVRTAKRRHHHLTTLFSAALQALMTGALRLPEFRDA